MTILIVSLTMLSWHARIRRERFIRKGNLAEVFNLKELDLSSILQAVFLEVLTQLDFNELGIRGEYGDRSLCDHKSQEDDLLSTNNLLVTIQGLNFKPFVYRFLPVRLALPKVMKSALHHWSAHSHAKWLLITFGSMKTMAALKQALCGMNFSGWKCDSSPFCPMRRGCAWWRTLWRGIEQFESNLRRGIGVDGTVRLNSVELVPLKWISRRFSTSFSMVVNCAL